MCATHSLQVTGVRVHFSNEAEARPHVKEGAAAGETSGAGVSDQGAKVTQTNRAGKLPARAGPVKAEAVLFDPAREPSTSAEITLRRSKVWLAKHEAGASSGSSTPGLLTPESSQGTSELGV